jgi:two-component system, OmpR family, alkaline phosphatase synthesis response regulator PhoP
MATALRILAIDDDQDARQMLGHMLRQAGYDVTLVGDAEQALQKLGESSFDIVISDICLPRLSGLDLLRQVREKGLDCEVIILTAFPAVDSAVQALHDGAIDYLMKPLTQEVLLTAMARVEEKLTQSRQRRNALVMLEAGLKHFTGQAQAEASLPPTAQPTTAKTGERYEVGSVTVDLDRFVVEVGGQRVGVTSTEFEILLYLCRHLGRVVKLAELVESLRGYQTEPGEASEIIRPHVSNLRRKLLEASPQADVIETVRGVGYVVRPAKK